MNDAAVIIDGDRELRRALKNVADGTADLKAVHAEAADIVATAAKRLVPTRSGVLGASIRSSGQARTGVVRAGRARVPYAGVIHFGWPSRNIRPNPFLYDALDDRRSEVVDKYEERVSDLIRRHNL